MSSNINSTSDHVKLPIFVYILNGLELLPLGFALFWTPLTALVFFSRPLCHRNLIVIMTKTAAMFVLMQLSRLVVVIEGFVDPQNILAEPSLFHHWAPACYADMLRAWAGFVAVCDVAVMITERVIATIRITNYEQHSHTLVTLVVLVGTSAFGIFGLDLIYTSYETLMVATAILGGLIVYVAVNFRFCRLLIARQMRNSRTANNGGYTLSQRYQMRENVRLYGVLKRTMIAFVICTSFMLSCFLFALYVLNDPFGNGVYLLRGGINLVISTSSNVLIVAGITGTHVWREALRSHLRSIFCAPRQFLQFSSSVVRPSIPKVPVLRDVDGRQLNFTSNQESELYFQQLHKAWK